jgi:DNA-binding response OmpR family regulator
MKGPTAAKKILIIDDDQGFALALTRFLEKAGYAVRRAENGEEGLRMAAREFPDLIFLDFMMPTKTGFEVCQELRLIPGLCTVPVIVLTAFGQNIGEIHGLRQGETGTQVQAVLEKPIEPNVLLERLAEALSHQAQAGGV